MRSRSYRLLSGLPDAILARHTPCARPVASNANTEGYELWTPGAGIFPKLDLPRIDVRKGENPSELKKLIE
jgi:hypothetical protein